MTASPPVAAHPKKSGLRIHRRTSIQSLPMTFLSRAAALPGKTLAVAVALASLADLAGSPRVTLGHWALNRFSISPDAACDALTRLANAGLIRADRQRGRHPVVVLLDESGSERLPDRGPSSR